MEPETLLKVLDERALEALTGVNEKPRKIITQKSEERNQANKAKAYEEAVLRGERVRRPGGGRKGVLERGIDAVMFALYYLKTYPTFDVLGSVFGLSRAGAHANLVKILNLLEEVLTELDLRPTRELQTAEEFQQVLGGTGVILIDVTEREQQRPKDQDPQKQMYSGKKKRHPWKNTIIATSIKRILYVGQTVTGHHHDYKRMTNEFNPEIAWFSNIEVYVDLGYQGIRKDYKQENINIPQKKPRKSKQNPNPKLTTEEKKYNQEISKIRIGVEHAIGGMKRYTILVHRFRNRIEGFADKVIAICAGLWNLNVVPLATR
jgi:hypothetical protein